MIELERRYRRLLRLLPGYYRQAWADDMVATFLAGALPADPEDAEFVAEYRRPEFAEVASVVGLAVRLRLGGAGAPPRSLAWGEAVRRVALAGMLTHAVNALAWLGALVWLADGALDRNAMMWSLSGLGWVAAYLALVLGYLRPARQLAGLSLVLVAITTGIDLANDGAHLASHGAGVVVAAVPVLALVAFNEQAPPVQARPWLVALPVGTVLVTAVLLHPGDGDLVDWPALACAAVFAAALACLIAPSWGGGPSWPIALVLLALAALVLRVTTLLEQLRYTAVPERDLPVTAALVEVVAVLIVAVPLVVRAARTLRDLPEAVAAREPGRP